MFGDAPVDLGLANFLMTDEVPWTGCEKSQPDDAVGGTRKENVASDLFFDKLPIRFVLIETADDVVSVGPGMSSRFVFVITVALRIAGEIEPVLCKLFTKSGRGEEPVDESRPRFFRIGRGRMEKIIDLHWSRRQAGEVKSHSPDQRG